MDAESGQTGQSGFMVLPASRRNDSLQVHGLGKIPQFGMVTDKIVDGIAGFILAIHFFYDFIQVIFAIADFRFFRFKRAVLRNPLNFH
ncbi:hypothetical protein DSECCO2_493420 [anaerobic digester metagenome]